MMYFVLEYGKLSVVFWDGQTLTYPLIDNKCLQFNEINEILKIWYLIIYKIIITRINIIKW